MKSPSMTQAGRGMRLLAIGFLSVIMALLWSVPSMANGKSGFTTLCEETASLDADGKKEDDNSADDQISVSMKLKTRDDKALYLEASSSVSNSNAFSGGMAEWTLVTTPADHSFMYFAVPVNPGDCSRAESTVAVYDDGNGGTVLMTLGDVINEHLEEHAYNAVQALTNFPQTAYNSDLESLVEDVCNEVKSTVTTQGGMVTLGTSATIGSLAGSMASNTLPRCLGNNTDYVHYVDVNSDPENPVVVACTAEQMAAASADLDALIPSIPAITLTAASDGAGTVSASATDADGCTNTVSMDLSTCTPNPPQQSGTCP